LRIVLDTNVIVSGLLNPEGNPGRVLDLFLAGEVTLIVDDRILAEYRAVLRRPKFGFDDADVSDFLDLLEAESERVAAAPLGSKLPDESDRPFLEVALAGGAESLVTGNVRHFRLAQVGRLPIESPAEFVRRWTQSKKSGREDGESQRNRLRSSSQKRRIRP
jgi:putative PIN family toxin of toxin-antitoxin system